MAFSGGDSSRTARATRECLTPGLNKCLSPGDTLLPPQPDRIQTDAFGINVPPEPTDLGLKGSTPLRRVGRGSYLSPEYLQASRRSSASCRCSCSCYLLRCRRSRREQVATAWVRFLDRSLVSAMASQPIEARRASSGRLPARTLKIALPGRSGGRWCGYSTFGESRKARVRAPQRGFDEPVGETRWNNRSGR